jgi:hypothetical protein
MPVFEIGIHIILPQSGSISAKNFFVKFYKFPYSSFLSVLSVLYMRIYKI